MTLNAKHIYFPRTNWVNGVLIHTRIFYSHIHQEIQTEKQNRDKTNTKHELRILKQNNRTKCRSLVEKPMKNICHLILWISAIDDFWNVLHGMPEISLNCEVCCGNITWGSHDAVIKWKHFPRYWPFVQRIHWSLWISHTKASDVELWCFTWSVPE